jgi:preprotein translocase subunit SecD
MVTLALILAGILAVGSQAWWGGATLQAALRFEVRLAEDQPAAGLFAARVTGTDRVVYLHQETIVTNDDIAQSGVVAGSGPSRFGIEVLFTTAGAEKMRRATAGHIGKPVAVLIDGEVVMAPVLRSPIGASAVISGDFTRAEAERIVEGIGIP